MLVLNTHETSTVELVQADVLVVVSHEGLLESVEVLHVLLSHFGNSDASGSFEMANLTKVVLTSNNAVGDAFLLAEGWQEGHHLNWLDITSDGDQFSFTFFNQGGDVVETEFEVDWLWTNVSGLVAALSGLSLGLESIFLLRLGLWRVLGEQFHELTLLVLLNGLSEDVKLWWTLESHEKHSLLPLDSDVLWPFDISSQVSNWLDGSTDSEVSSTLLEERSRSSRFGSGSGRDDLLSRLLLSLWHV